jgi:hypothetical protein
MADWLDALERLQKLKLSGVLTDQEFETEKRKLLGLPEQVETDAAQTANLAAFARLKKLRGDDILNEDEYELERKRLVEGVSASPQSPKMSTNSDNSSDNPTSLVSIATVLAAFATAIAVGVYLLFQPQFLNRAASPDVAQTSSPATPEGRDRTPKVNQTDSLEIINGSSVIAEDRQSEINAKCRLIVGTKIYIDGPCSYSPNMDSARGSFDFNELKEQNVCPEGTETATSSCSMAELRNVQYGTFGGLKVTGDKVGTLYWNGGGGTQAHEEIKPLYRKGACWSNPNAENVYGLRTNVEFCAWR